MRTATLVVFPQPLFKVPPNVSVVNHLVCLADQDVNVEEVFHLLACQAVVFGAPREKLKNSPPSLRYGVAAFAFRCAPKRRLGPPGFEPGTKGL